MNNPSFPNPQSQGLWAEGLICLNPQADGCPAGLQGERQPSSVGQFVSHPATWTLTWSLNESSHTQEIQGRWLCKSPEYERGDAWKWKHMVYLLSGEPLGKGNFYCCLPKFVFHTLNTNTHPWVSVGLWLCQGFALSPIPNQSPYNNVTIGWFCITLN